MRYLFCSLDSYGFIYPVIGLAKQLQAQGHEVAVATSPACQAMLAEQGLARIPYGEEDGRSFETKLLTHPHESARQIKHLTYALKTYDPEVLVTQQLVLGPLLVAEWYQLPIAVIGQGVYMYPKATPGPHEVPATPHEQRAVRTHTDLLAAYNGARALFRQPPREIQHYDDSPLLGDLFLLRNVPAFEQLPASLQGRVQQVGDCLWEPTQPPDPALEAWLEEARALQHPILYVQPGRIHLGISFWPALCEALGNTPVRVVAAVGRLGEEAVGTLPANFFARPHIPQGAVLPHAQLAISSSTSTAVLGALTHGVPMLLIVSRDGEQQPLLDRCQHLGVARELDLFALEPTMIRQTVWQLLEDAESQRQARRLQAAFQSAPEQQRAISLLEQLPLHGKVNTSTST